MKQSSPAHPPSRITRRELAAALAAAPLAAQTQPAASPAGDLQKARQRITATGEVLARLSVPMDAEPAFQFRA